MAQEVRNIDQRTPPTTQHRDRIPSRPVFVPPSDIYETKDSIVCSLKCRVWLPMA